MLETINQIEKAQKKKDCLTLINGVRISLAEGDNIPVSYFDFLNRYFGIYPILKDGNIFDVGLEGAI